MKTYNGPAWLNRELYLEVRGTSDLGTVFTDTPECHSSISGTYFLFISTASKYEYSVPASRPLTHPTRRKPPGRWASGLMRPRTQAQNSTKRTCQNRRGGPRAAIGGAREVPEPSRLCCFRFCRSIEESMYMNECVHIRMYIYIYMANSLTKNHNKPKRERKGLYA